ncbi:MAG: PspC domain-containing protein [Prevotellaceae bacterium]|jgi:phage shock protein PspC (stress-responsive transcriptional regulator)|nr:PspC domain-containing protein [Prevotellaceae bacterium]
MKRVETISINGIIFSITDDAFRSLSDYLESLYKYFEHEEGGNEIITDIEARIAELLTERAGGITRAITNKDVLHVIETLGALEDITNSDGGDDGNKPPYSNPKKYSKRLYRDPDHNVFGGVCAGIAAWLEISPVIVRLIFVVCFLFYGISILIYFLLWIIIPLAKTTAQKLEMHGEPINISNIERGVRDNMASSGFRPSSYRHSDETGGANKLLKTIWTIIRIVAGIILCGIGISMALSFFSLFLLHDLIFEWHFWPFNRFFPYIIPASSYKLIYISLILFAVLTVAACIYWGIKAITGHKVKYPQIHIVLLIIWFVFIPVIMIYFAREVGNYFGYNKLVKTIPVETCDTVYLSLHSSDLEISDYFSESYFDNENKRFYGKPEIYINKSERKSKLQIEKISRGKNNQKAYKLANDIDYKFDVHNSQIIFSPYFTVEPLRDWKNQRLKIVLSVPENTIIIVDESLCYSDIIVRPRRSGHDGNACKWIMTREGIKALRQ